MRYSPRKGWERRNLAQGVSGGNRLPTIFATKDPAKRFSRDKTGVAMLKFYV
jgi:hypothetical protein